MKGQGERTVSNRDWGNLKPVAKQELTRDLRILHPEQPRTVQQHLERCGLGI